MISRWPSPRPLKAYHMSDTFIRAISVCANMELLHRAKLSLADAPAPLCLDATASRVSRRRCEGDPDTLSRQPAIRSCTHMPRSAANRTRLNERQDVREDVAELAPAPRIDEPPSSLHRVPQRLRRPNQVLCSRCFNIKCGTPPRRSLGASRLAGQQANPSPRPTLCRTLIRPHCRMAGMPAGEVGGRQGRRRGGACSVSGLSSLAWSTRLTRAVSSWRSRTHLASVNDR